MSRIMTFLSRPANTGAPAGDWGSGAATLQRAWGKHATKVAIREHEQQRSLFPFETCGGSSGGTAVAAGGRGDGFVIGLGGGRKRSRALLGRPHRPSIFSGDLGHHRGSEIANTSPVVVPASVFAAVRHPPNYEAETPQMKTTAECTPRANP